MKSDYWILCVPIEGKNEATIIGGIKSQFKPSIKQARRLSKCCDGKAVWNHWSRFFESEREAMEYMK